MLLILICQDWNVLSRTILRLVHQNGTPTGTDGTRVGAILRSLPVPPKEPRQSGGIILGVAPARLAPSPTNEALGVAPMSFTEFVWTLAACAGVALPGMPDRVLVAIAVSVLALREAAARLEVGVRGGKA